MLMLVKITGINLCIYTSFVISVSLVASEITYASLLTNVTEGNIHVDFYP